MALKSRVTQWPGTWVDYQRNRRGDIFQQLHLFLEGTVIQGSEFPVTGSVQTKAGGPPVRDFQLLPSLQGPSQTLEPPSHLRIPSPETNPSLLISGGASFVSVL